MTVPTKSEAKSALAPYHDLIREVVEAAWAEWRELQALRVDKGMAPILYTRTISNYVFDAIARRAIPRFAAQAKVHVEVEAQTFKLFVNGLLVRFKKGGHDKLGCSIPTLAAQLFEDADAQLPGFPPETGKVEIIWLPNSIWTQLDRVLVVARDGDRLLWEYEIESASGAGSGDVIPFPTPTDGAAGPSSEDLVKPKGTPVDKPDAQ